MREFSSAMVFVILLAGSHALVHAPLRVPAFGVPWRVPRSHALMSEEETTVQSLGVSVDELVEAVAAKQGHMDNEAELRAAFVRALETEFSPPPGAEPHAGDEIEFKSGVLRGVFGLAFEVRSFVQGAKSELEVLQVRAVEKARIDVTLTARAADWALRRAMFDTGRVLGAARSALTLAPAAHAERGPHETGDDAAGPKGVATGAEAAAPFASRLRSLDDDGRALLQQSTHAAPALWAAEEAEAERTMAEARATADKVAAARWLAMRAQADAEEAEARAHVQAKQRAEAAAEARAAAAAEAEEAAALAAAQAAARAAAQAEAEAAAQAQAEARYAHAVQTEAAAEAASAEEALARMAADLARELGLGDDAASSNGRVVGVAGLACAALGMERAETEEATLRSCHYAVFGTSEQQRQHLAEMVRLDAEARELAGWVADAAVLFCF